MVVDELMCESRDRLRHGLLWEGAAGERRGRGADCGVVCEAGPAARREVIEPENVLKLLPRPLLLFLLLVHTLHTQTHVIKS